LKGVTWAGEAQRRRYDHQRHLSPSLLKGGGEIEKFRQRAVQGEANLQKKPIPQKRAPSKSSAGSHVTEKEVLVGGRRVEKALRSGVTPR